MTNVTLMRMSEPNWGVVDTRVYALTELGKKVTRNMDGGTDEMRVLNYLRDNKTATDDQLDVVGERWVVKRLKKRGLIKELTNA